MNQQPKRGRGRPTVNKFGSHNQGNLRSSKEIEHSVGQIDEELQATPPRSNLILGDFIAGLNSNKYESRKNGNSKSGKNKSNSGMRHSNSGIRVEQSIDPLSLVLLLLLLLLRRLLLVSRCQMLL